MLPLSNLNPRLHPLIRIQQLLKPLNAPAFQLSKVITFLSFHLKARLPVNLTLHQPYPSGWYVICEVRYTFGSHALTQSACSSPGVLYPRSCIEVIASDSVEITGQIEQVNGGYYSGPLGFSGMQYTSVIDSCVVAEAVEKEIFNSGEQREIVPSGAFPNLGISFLLSETANTPSCQI